MNFHPKVKIYCPAACACLPSCLSVQLLFNSGGSPNCVKKHKPAKANDIHDFYRVELNFRKSEFVDNVLIIRNFLSISKCVDRISNPNPAAKRFPSSNSVYLISAQSTSTFKRQFRQLMVLIFLQPILFPIFRRRVVVNCGDGGVERRKGKIINKHTHISRQAPCPCLLNGSFLFTILPSYHFVDWIHGLPFLMHFLRALMLINK